MKDSDKLLLVGSVPYEAATDVFDSFGKALGPWLDAIPDGEIGHRKHWVSRVHYEVLAVHQDLEVVSRPAPEDGVERLSPRHTGDSWKFRVRPGVDRIRFGDPGWRLGFARDAVASYFAFRTYREQGKLPATLRFQVSMPSPHSAIPPRIFPDPADAARVRPGYTEALAAELDKIVEKIPSKDLAIQWDCATELQEAYGSAETPPDIAVERNLEQIRVLAAHIPEPVELGYHFCFGTLGGWPRFAPADLSGAVRLANAVVEASGRPVSWIHIPVLDTTEEAFFAPLRDLRPRGARVYLGMIHHVESLAERLAIARRFLPEFGLGAYCGFGRIPPSELDAILQEHLTAVRLAG